MFDFTTVRDTVVSFAGTIVCAAVLVAAAVLPAQVAVAATLGL